MTTKALVIPPKRFTSNIDRTAVKVAKIQAQQIAYQRYFDIAKAIITHPVIGMVGGCIGVEWLQSHLTFVEPGSPAEGYWVIPGVWWFTTKGATLPTEKKLISQGLATMMEAGILMWGTKTTVKDVGDVLEGLLSALKTGGAVAGGLGGLVAK